MFYSFVNFAYGISAFLMVVSVIIVANRMDDCTRPLLKLCLVFLILAAAFFPMCKAYGWLNPVVTYLLIPFNFGVSIWLIINHARPRRYQQIVQVKI